MEIASTVPRMAELAACPSWRTVDFISDLHLSATEPATFSAWQHYLAHTPADAVFMLGDVFEVWVGDDAAAPRPDGTFEETGFEARCAEVLSQAAQRLALFFMHGNRDFLVGPAFMAQCRAVLLDDPTVLTFAGQRWLLSHGDALCLDDVDYLRFRQLVRGTTWQHDFLARPLAERQAIAFEMRRHSEARKHSGAAYADVDDPAARQWLAAAGAATLIHGHTHKPAAHDLGAGLSRIVLSDWDASAPVPRADVLRLSDSGLQRLALLAP
ncbi:MAG: UDP-2,3-diacylglucosamine diphosphatase [Polaromonas sp.]